VPLRLHRAGRADVLVVGLAELLSDVPADPFTPDVVSVPSRGVERWIAQSLSATLGSATGRSDGVCANVVFPSPGRLVRDALTAACGVDPDDDPWADRRLPWAVLAVIDGCATEAWCRTLGRHLGLLDGRVDGGPVNQGRRMAVAQKLAGLFSSYAAERPTMLLGWRDDSDTDGHGTPLDPDHAWQAELWRRLRRHLDSESPAERLRPACERLREDPDVVDLPQRLSLFGPTRLATDQLAVLDALAAHREVHLWLPHPSDGLWRHVGEALHAASDVPTRREDPTAQVPDHPLVRSLGRDAREMQVRLRAHAGIAADDHLATPKPATTLLGALQHDLHRDRNLDLDHDRHLDQDPDHDRHLDHERHHDHDHVRHLDARPTRHHRLADDDTSVQVHSCHGRHRQVEVLREVLLGLLADDPTLELRDVIVMCPDIEAYAPLISAAFGLEALDDEDVGGPTDVHPGHRLTFRLADRSLRQTNPVLGVAARLLDLADSRLTASEVLDLLAMPPVRRRFGLDDDALERAGDWVRRAGVRWGLDAAARAPYGLDGIAQNTWQHGLDRVLVGVAMDEDDGRTVGSALPLDDVDSTEAGLAGRLAELLDRVHLAVDRLRREQPLEDWLFALDEAVDSLVDVAPRDAWQVTQAKATLAGAAADADRGDGAAAGIDDHATGAPAPTLRLSDVRALLADRLAGRPTRANFRTGHLTVCTMVPMRSVPHRVVCLLGLDDGVFPRGTHVDGDDVLARRPRVGERDRRSEDRQLFLDAILAAEERLVVLYTGADERTGAERPPAVPLGELLDVLDRTARTPTGRVRDRVLVHHPLQPFDARNFTHDGLGRADRFSFDHASYDGSRALRDGQTAPRPFLAEPLPEIDLTDVLALDRLIRFLEHPVRGFLQQRLDLRTADEQDEPSDAVPVLPDSLEQWQVGDRLLRAGLAGHDLARAEAVERLRGELPPGRLGSAVITPVSDNVRALLDKSSRMLAGTPDTLDVSVDLPSGVTLVGTVPRVHAEQITRIEYSKLSAKHRIRAWVQLLALSAHSPDRGWRAATVGRGDRKSPVLGSFLTGPDADEALAHLDALVRIHRLGMTRPLPVPPKTACAYAEKRRSGAAPQAAASFAGQQWRRSSGQSPWGEFDDGDHRLVGFESMEHLLAVAPGAAAGLSGEYDDEPHLFGMLARQIWTPLLERERVTG
jgi:exodeoxyribonuclease V gamma subunit